jgi:hypothetical protein
MNGAGEFMALSDQMLCKCKANNGGMERGGLRSGGLIVGITLFLVSSLTKGKVCFELGVKNDGVVCMTQGFKTLDQGLNSGFVVLQQSHGELNQGDADGDARSGVEVVGKSHLVEQGLHLLVVHGDGLVKDAVVDSLDGGPQNPAHAFGVGGPSELGP